MPSDLALIDGSTYFLSTASGDIEVKGAEGFFHMDMRHLSVWSLRIDGEPMRVLASSEVDYYSARVVGTLASAGPGTNPPVSITRSRFVAGGVHEDVRVENHSDESRQVTVELTFGSDFGDIFECRTSPTKKGEISLELGEGEVTLRYRRGDYSRGTRIAFSEPCALTRHRATFDLTLGPRESWGTCIDVTPIVGDEEHRPRQACDSFGEATPDVPLSLEEWLEELPKLETGWDVLEHTYGQSLVDLASLRFRPLEGLSFSLPAAGLPWFMTLFGRDSIVAAFETLPFEPRLARTTLEALSRLQATEDDPYRDAEPGKIMHELRVGELVTLGDKPHNPYYGSHDATPLFLILLDEYERWSGDADFVRELEPTCRAAIEWIERHGDLDGDGYLEYRRRSEDGLGNQCWKDSDNSIVFADGSLAEGPLAVCEVQGYAYDARLRTARLARAFWGDEALAERLEADAARLRERFNADFWIEERGHYALALDGEKRRVDSCTSNPGRLLWSGIVDEERAARVAERLLRPDMFSGYGVRTMSTEDAAYNPIEYHNGTVWPHDNAIIAEGLRRYGFRDEASKLAVALVEAAGKFDHRLPEVFAGTARDEADLPVEYPTASSPQAWAAAAPLSALRTLLGLDVEDGQLTTSPHVPEQAGTIGLRGLRVHGERVDVEG
ncbi:MAG: amylo-alpha-1,6-glucosidase [Actinobacteria bacterium]|nr:amylo-alpha-1,6-glucosidase [Actinomycetota bacterium]